MVAYLESPRCLGFDLPISSTRFSAGRQLIACFSSVNLTHASAGAITARRVDASCRHATNMTR